MEDYNDLVIKYNKKIEENTEAKGVIDSDFKRTLISLVDRIQAELKEVQKIVDQMPQIDDVYILMQCPERYTRVTSMIAKGIEFEWNTNMLIGGPHIKLHHLPKARPDWFHSPATLSFDNYLYKRYEFKIDDKNKCEVLDHHPDAGIFGIHAPATLDNIIKTLRCNIYQWLEVLIEKAIVKEKN